MAIRSSEHRLLPIPFTVLTLCGSWHLDTWSASKKRIYKLYTIAVISLAMALLLQVLANVIATIGKPDFRLENIYATIVFCIGMLKKLLLMHERKRIRTLVRYCARDPQQWHDAQNPGETMVKRSIDSETKRVSLVYAVLIAIGVALRAAQPVVDEPTATLLVLPLDACYPYSTDNVLVFLATYLHQVVAGVILTCMHLTSDTLFVGLMLQLKCQLAILALRLERLRRLDNVRTSEHDLQLILARNVNAHERIYRFGHDLQRVFKKMSMGQMIVVIPNLIINVYFLSVYADRLSLKYCMTLFFFVVPLMQIYMFCWYGNEVVVACSNISCAVYRCDWISLDKSTRKLLLPIVMRSTRPIVLSAGVVIPYNIDSFIKIMKTSYSAFNIIQQAANE